MVTKNCTELRDLLVRVCASDDPRLTGRAVTEVMCALRALGDGAPQLAWESQPVADVVEDLTRALDLVADAIDERRPIGDLVALGLVGRHVNHALGAIRVAALDDAASPSATGVSTAAFGWLSENDLGRHHPLAPTDFADLADIVAALATAVTSLASAMRTVDVVVRRQGEQLDSLTVAWARMRGRYRSRFAGL